VASLSNNFLLQQQPSGKTFPRSQAPPGEGHQLSELRSRLTYQVYLHMTQKKHQLIS
ncbi:Immediate-early protein 2, partial [Dissostichus eleginoides]